MCLTRTILLALVICNLSFETVYAETIHPRSYYISTAGKDINPGNKNAPFRSIEKLNSLSINPGDSILLEGGQTFSGSLIIHVAGEGNRYHPFYISSYGKGTAVIQSGNEQAVLISQTSWLEIQNLKLVGSGRSKGNTNNGFAISNCKHIRADKLEITGFQKSGFLIYASENISVNRVFAYENGFAGISMSGVEGNKKSNLTIYIGHCRTENNPGDPTNLKNHSGNGIVVAQCTNVKIEYCTATNNGWDMPRIGNGPVGIWAYEADSVIIQHCISFRNKTSKGGADGGGFDLDGGVTHSIVQYNKSYENQGAGYCIFQYLYASEWHDNIFRYNTSKDDGLVSDARSGVYIWNSSRDSNQFYNCLFEHNKIYNSKEAAIHFSELSARKGFTFSNNYFTGHDSLILGDKGVDHFISNQWRLNGKEPYINADLPAIKWNDTEGHFINAHGAGILFYHDTYYMFGEIKKGSTWLVPHQSWENYRVPAGGVSCYSSKDFKKWKYEGVALAAVTGDSTNELDTGRVVERPKVVYNASTKKFVMWMHIDKNDYSYARAGVAVSDHPQGPFKYLGSVRPNDQESRDMTLFQDDDGKAYLIYASEGNSTMQICLLNADYLSPTKNYTRILVNRNREAPAVFKQEGKYYLITSLCSGWTPNAASYAVADHIQGEWKTMGNPCIGPGAETTFDAQSTYVLPLQGKNGSYLFMSDRWNKTDLPDSRYCWLPLHILNGKVEIKIEDHP